MELYEAIEKRRTVRDFEDNPVDMDIIKRILSAGLKTPTGNHPGEWEFPIVNDKKKRSGIPNSEDMTSYDECEKMIDGFGMTDSGQTGRYRIAMPEQFSMLYNSGCSILPFLN